MNRNCGKITEAFDKATNHLQDLSAEEKGHLVQDLYQAFIFAETEKKACDGLTAPRLQDALLGVVRSLEHTPDFKTRIDSVACTLASNAGNSMDGVLSYLAHWDTLGKKEKRLFAQSAIETMQSIIRDEFGFDDNFKVSTKFVKIKPYDIPDRYPSDKTHMSAIDIYRGTWEIRVNEAANSSYDNGLELMKDIFESGIKIAQNELGYMKHAMGFKQMASIPPELKPDADNVSATYVFGLVSFSDTKHKVDSVLFTNVYAKERSTVFAEDLAQQLEDRGPDLPRPHKQTAIESIVQALRFK